MKPESYHIASKISATTVVWVTCSFILGITAGLWALLVVPSVLFRRLRPLWIYLIPCLGGITAGLSTVERDRLPTEGLHRAVAVVQSDMGGGYYDVTMLGFSDTPSSEPSPCRVRTAAIFDKAPGTTLSRGDTLIFTVGISDIESLNVSPRSRLGLAYKKGVRQVAAVYDRDYAVLCAPLSTGLAGWAKRARESIVSRIDELSIGDDDKSVLAAMTAGAKGEVSAFAKGRYRRGGISHLMAISGMHVGVLYLLLCFILRPVARTYRGRISASIATVTVLWAYALISGMSPSVLRATVMFTFIALRGNAPANDTTRYNTLFGSALLLLVIDPSLIYDIGFQLSYLSVLAIMFFVPKIVSLLPERSPLRRNVLLRILFMAAVITTVVQIFTMPLTLYAFGQLSVVSLLNNMAVALLAAPLMILSAIYGFAPVPVIDHSIRYIFDVINDTLDITSGLPYAYIRDIEFPAGACMAAFVMLLLVMVKTEMAYVRKTERTRQ